MAPLIQAVIDAAGPEGTATSQMLTAVDAVMQDDEVRVITDAGHNNLCQRCGRRYCR